MIMYKVNIMASDQTKNNSISDLHVAKVKDYLKVIYSLRR